MEACTLLGCAASDWSSTQTLESPPAGQPAPLLELQTNPKGIQTVFLLSWSPPAELNGKLLHFELYRKHALNKESRSATTLVYRNSSTSCHDDKLLPYTAYEYQVTPLGLISLRCIFTLQISEFPVIGAFEFELVIPKLLYYTKNEQTFYIFPRKCDYCL